MMRRFTWNPCNSDNSPQWINAEVTYRGPLLPSSKEKPWARKWRASVIGLDHLDLYPWTSFRTLSSTSNWRPHWPNADLMVEAKPTTTNEATDDLIGLMPISWSKPSQQLPMKKGVATLHEKCGPVPPPLNIGWLWWDSQWLQQNVACKLMPLNYPPPTTRHGPWFSIVVIVYQGNIFFPFYKRKT